MVAYLCMEVTLHFLKWAFTWRLLWLPLHGGYLGYLYYLTVQVVLCKFHSVYLSKTGCVLTSGHGQGGRLGHGNEQSVMVRHIFFLCLTSPLHMVMCRPPEWWRLLSANIVYRLQLHETILSCLLRGVCMCAYMLEISIQC